MNGAELTLTRRESEVAELFAWGASKKEVAERLYISERTVENHARTIYDKTGCSKVNELSAWWFCTHFNISFDFSPLKRVISIIIFFAFVQSNIVLTKEYERYYRRNAKDERTALRRRNENEDDYLLITSNYS
jgi:DNA-binding CsgD family transcriptional regulator